MKNEDLHTFLLEQLKSVENHLKDLAKDADIEHLHHLRVNIKKIRAVLSFITGVYAEKFESGGLKILFKKAGKVRELQINIDVIHSLPDIPEAVIAKWMKTEKRKLRDFIKRIPEYRRLVKRFRKKSFLSYPFPNEIITVSYIRELSIKAMRRFNSRQRADMHRFRKLIRKLMFLYELLPAKNQGVFGIDIKRINQLQKEVGAWHDTYSAIAFIRKRKFDHQSGCISILIAREADQFEKLIVSYTNLRI